MLFPVESYILHKSRVHWKVLLVKGGTDAIKKGNFIRMEFADQDIENNHQGNLKRE